MGSNEQWTAAEAREYFKTGKLPTPKALKNKYNARKTEYNGRTYDSKFEAEVAALLDMRKKAKEIKRITPQYKIGLEHQGVFICNYYADFRVVMADGSIEIWEAKGKETDVFKHKWKLLKAQLEDIEPGATLVLVKKVKGKIKEVERCKSE